MAEITIKGNSQKEEINKLINLAMAFRKVDSVKAIQNWDKAEKLCNNLLDDYLCANLYYKRAQSYYLDNVYDKALEFAYKSERISLNIADSNFKGSVYLLKGNIYLALYKFEKAIAAFKEAYNLFRGEENSELFILSLFSIGNAYNWADDLKRARNYLKHALELSVEKDYKEIEMKCTGSLGILATKSGEFKIAEYYFERALAIVDAHGDTRMKIQVLKSMGNLYNESEDYEKAIQMLKTALKEADYEDPQQAMELIHNFLADSYEKTGDYKNSLIHYKHFQNILENRLNSENQERIIVIEKEYKTETLKKEAEIHRLRNVELTEAYKDLQSAQRRLIHQEKLAVLGQLSSGIAHEIQNPLNFVKNFAESSNELIDDLQKEIVEIGSKEKLSEVKDILNSLRENNQIIKKHGVRASKIVRNILRHAREQYDEKQKTQIESLLDDCIALTLEGSSSQMQIEIHKKYTTEEICLDVYPADLSRVFVNILQNAVYAIKRKSDSIEDDEFSPFIKLETILDDNWLKINFSNNGEQIHHKIKNKIFNPFFTTKPDGEGTGLGLFLSQDIIEKEHGGELELLQVDNLTCFQIRLPML